MLTYEQFKKYIEEVQLLTKLNNAITDIERPYVLNGKLFQYSELYYFPIESKYIDLLSYAMDVDPEKDDILSWWVYETNYGKDYEQGSVEDSNVDKVPDLSTLAGIYEYLKKISYYLKDNTSEN